MSLRRFLPLVAFGYLSIGCGVGVVFLDDGCLNTAALRILQGGIPYRDFFTLPTPGYHYFLALLFKVFGVQLLWTRLATCAALALAASGIHRLARAAFSPDAGLIAWAVSLVWLANSPHYLGTMPPALMFGAWSAAYFLENAEKPAQRTAYLSGVFCALSVMCRQDAGVCVAVGELLTPAYAALRGQKMAGGRAYAFGLGVVLLPIAAYFAVLVPWKDLVFNFIAYPLKIYPDYHRLAYPSLAEGLRRVLTEPSWTEKILLFSLQIPRLTLWSSVPAIVLALRTKNPARGRGLFLIGTLGLLFFLQARLRPDDWHLLPAIVLAAPLAAALLAALFLRGAGRFAAAAVLLLILAGPMANKASTFFLAGLQPFPLERARGIVYGPPSWTPGVRNYEAAVNYVRQNTAPGEPIFVTSARNDRLCMADPLFYFFADRPSGVRLQEMYRGWAIRPEVQRGLIGELESKKVRYVVLRRDLDNMCGEANASSEPGSTMLDEYFRANFDAERIFGSEIILRRK